MKLTKGGFRISKNGSIINSIEKEAIRSMTYLGYSLKDNGTYYFLNRIQAGVYIYLP